MHQKKATLFHRYTITSVAHPIQKLLGLYYFPDSNLFIAIGSQGFGGTPAVYYYFWTGKKLKLLKIEMN